MLVAKKSSNESLLRLLGSVYPTNETNLDRYMYRDCTYDVSDIFSVQLEDTKR